MAVNVLSSVGIANRGNWRLEIDMAYDRRKTADVLFFALQCAKSDRQAFIEAYHSDESEPAVQNAIADIKAFERLQQKLFGTTRSELDQIADNMKPINLYELRRIMNERPDLFDWADSE